MVWRMTLQGRIADHAARLTDADRRILEVLLSHPTEASFLSAAEVSTRAGVHQASATKLAQRLGYSGYPELRRSLQHDLLEGSSPADRVQRRLELAGPGSLLDALVDDETSAMRDLSRQVTQDQLDAAGSLVLQAGHRYVFAHGNGSVLGDLLVRRLTRFGLPSTVLAPSGRDMAEQLVGLRPEDIVVAFAFLRTPPHLADLTDFCRDVGASLVLITDTLGPEFEGLADVVLSGARGSGREFQSLTVPMAIANALVLTIARQAPDLTTESLALLEKLLARFDR